MNIRIPESEWEVLRVLWKRGACSVSQVKTTLAQSGNNYTLGAVRSFLVRLAAKGIVRQLDDEPIQRFEALYPEEKLLVNERNTFLEKYYDGTVSSFLAQYLKSENVSKNELDRLRELIDDYRETEQ